MRLLVVRDPEDRRLALDDPLEGEDGHVLGVAEWPVGGHGLSLLRDRFRDHRSGEIIVGERVEPRTGEPNLKLCSYVDP
jgi:hypothetical protein